MKRLILIATVVAALAAILVVGVAAAYGPHSGNGQQAGMMSGNGDMLHTQDRIQLHVDAPDAVTPPTMGAGAVAWLPDGATIDSVTRDVQVDGNVKTVTATFTVTLSDGSQTEMQRVHTYELQSDGTWLLTSAPDCPYR